MDFTFHNQVKEYIDNYIQQLKLDITSVIDSSKGGPDDGIVFLSGYTKEGEKVSKKFSYSLSFWLKKDFNITIEDWAEQVKIRQLPQKGNPSIAVFRHKLGFTQVVPIAEYNRTYKIEYGPLK